MGLSIYSKSITIIEEVKDSIKAITKMLEDKVSHDKKASALEDRSPLLWSVQYTIPQGLEAILCEIDKTWYGQLVPVQRVRPLIFATAITVVLVSIISYFIWRSLNNVDTAEKHHAIFTSTTEPHHNTTHPTTTIANKVECDVSKECEAKTDWRDLAKIIKENAHFGIKTIQDFNAACGGIINIGAIIISYWQICLAADPSYFKTFSDPSTPLTVILTILQNHTNATSGTLL